MSLIRKILLVSLPDDEASEIRTRLENDRGCAVHSVSRGQEALDIIRKSEPDNPFHVLISETRMSTLNGIGLANQLKDQKSLIPIILVSDTTISEHILATASPYYLLKDTTGKINITELMKMVHMTLYHPIQTE